MRAFLLSLLLAGMLPAAEEGQRLWWRAAWPFRRTVTFTSKDGAGYAAVRLATFGRTRHDAGDIRVVVDDRTVIPHALLDYGRDASALVTFAVPDPKRMYRLYFGEVNTKPASQAKRQTSLHRRAGVPPAGLFCEVRSLSVAEAGDGTDLDRLLAASADVLGCDVVARSTDRCALGLNPFDASREYLVVWHGRLRVAKPGTWTFATNSNGPSFVLVDGKVVASWSGWHTSRGGETGEHAGEVTLRKRSCRFAYVFAARGGRNGHVCGIKAPGEERLRPLTAGDCVPLLNATVGVLEEARSVDTLDFRWELVGDAGLSGRDVCRMRFTDRSDPGGQKIESWKWRFGDGQTGEGRRVEHVYLARGTYEVEVEITAAGGTILRNGARVAVHPRGARNVGFGELATATLSYRVSSLGLEALKNLVFLRWEDGREDCRYFYEAARALFRKKPKLAGGPLERYLEALLEHLFFREPEETAALAEFLLRAGKRHDLRVRAALAAGASYRYFLDKPREAERVWRMALHDGRLPPPAARLFTLLLSDAARARGDSAQAGTLYDDARRLPPPAGVTELTRGESVYRMRHHVAAREFARAWDVLNRYLAAAPETLLTGEVSFFRSAILAACGRSNSALRELERVLALEHGVARTTRRREVLLRAETLYEKTGDTEQARLMRERLKREFPGDR